MSPTTGEELMFGGEGGVKPAPRIRKNMERTRAGLLGSRMHVRGHTLVLNVVFDSRKNSHVLVNRQDKNS